MTISLATKWRIEVFPFDSEIPRTGDFGKPSDSTQVFTDDGLGVTSVVISRSKAAPDGQCNISMVGHLPLKFYVGAWCIVSSVTENRSLTRFIGQIENIDVSYNVADNGNIFVQSSIKVREWSAMLRMLVKYDVLSISYLLSQSSAGAGKLAQNLLGANISPFDVPNKDQMVKLKEMEQLYEQATNPYQYAQIVLKLIGALNSKDVIDESHESVSGVVPSIATTAPFIPTSVLDRLGVDGGRNGSNPYSSGFVRMITGIQSGPIYSDGTWNGIFGDEWSIDDVVKNYQEGYDKRSVTPITLGLQVTLSSGASAWDLLSTQCDNSINEVYTDFLYEQNSTGDIIGKPVIFVRNKPFLLRKIRDNKFSDINIQSDLKSFAVYDDLPRVSIGPESILTFRLNSTFLNSPNYIRISYQPQGILNKTGEALASTAGIVRLGPEMNRFGGNEYDVSISYTNTENISPGGESQGKGKIGDWFSQIKDLTTAWYSYGYRMATGILVLKEDNMPISVGNNVQFKFGKYNIVAHVEVINFDFQVGPDGLQSNLTTLTLTHIVQADESGELTFIHMSEFGNLLNDSLTPIKATEKLTSNKSKQISDFISGLRDA